MKKSKILVPAVALLALGMAASTTATVAWFQTSQATLNATAAGQTGNISAIAGFESVNNFVISVEALPSLSSVILTNSTGQTYSTLSDGGADVLVTASGTKIVALAPTLSITYTGSAATAAEVEALWDQAIGTGHIQLAITDETDYTSAGKANTKFSDALIAYAAGSHTKGTDYGLKFTSAADAYANASANAAKNAVFSDTIGFADPTGSGDAKTTTKSGLVSGVTFYVGICGINGVVQDADDTYTLKVAPSVVA